MVELAYSGGMESHLPPFKKNGSTVLYAVWHRLSRPVALKLVLTTALLTLPACHDSTGPKTTWSPPGGPDPIVGDWRSVSVGDNTTCALDRSGRAYCWGSNFRGRLGTGDTTGRVIEPRIVSGAPAQLRDLSVGMSHQCAITSDGRAFCWGENGSSQLGAGVNSATTSAFVAGGLTFNSISAGNRHTCAVTVQNAAYCWGDNTYNQLGAGDAAPCGAMVERPCRVPAPVPVAGDLRFAQVSAGRSHTCGLTLDGAAYCWGSNHDGELGDPTVPIHCVALPAVVACLRDFPVPVGGGLRFTQISAGAMHSCGVTATGAAHCWGLATPDAQIDASALGSTMHAGFAGASRGSRVPVPVEGGFTFAEVSAGNGRSCGVTFDGEALCWGINTFGQLGIATMNPSRSTRPQAVRMPSAAGAPALDEDDHACAVSTTGRIWCWGGYNFFGELGSPPMSEPMVSAIVRPTPAPVVSRGQGNG